MITAFRLCSVKYPGDDGQGASKFPGRWNAAGIPVVYSAASLASAALECLVHFDVLPIDYASTTIQIPDRLIEVVDRATLPFNWNAEVPVKETQEFGSKWCYALRSAVLSVPSSIVPTEANFILNPLHPDFAAILFSMPQPFQFDPRLR